MKNLSAPLALAILASFTACGSNLKSEKRPVKVSAEARVNEWGSSLSEGCRSRSGLFLKAEKLCIHPVITKDLAGGAYGKSEELTSLDIGLVNPGQAVLATGSTAAQSVQISLDGQVISPVPSPEKKPVAIGKAGKLEFQLKPGGYFDEVKVYVYSCVDESFREVRCPY